MVEYAVGSQFWGGSTMRWVYGLALLTLTAALPAAGDISLEVPVACNMAKVCSIQKYFDLDPGLGRLDYACGRLTGDGHDGTDIRVPDFPSMDRGVAVVAAAPGTVKAVRDGMADASVSKSGSGAGVQDAIAGREAGNGVVIDHGNGWETQYSHLKRGSIAVKPGDRVAVGHHLGLIGLSGQTEYPHVHFSVRSQGQSLDPFVGSAASFPCGTARRPLWSSAALAQLPYRPSGGLVAGFASERPDAETARRGAYAADELPASAPALVFWADVWGAAAGDLQRIRIESPGGQIVHHNETVLKDSNISWFAFSGRQRPSTGWQPGIYGGTYELVRDGGTVVSMSKQVTIAAR
jgi:peptidase M23-like protein